VDAHKLTKDLETLGSSLVPIHENLIDLAWGKYRPAAPKDNVFVQPVKYTGKKKQNSKLVPNKENTLFTPFILGFR
jgi:Xaa-Pro aminopeptidase